MTARALSDFDPTSLAALLVEWGHNPVHARRILHAYHVNCGALHAHELVRMSVPLSLRERIVAEINERQSHVANRHDSADGTTKLLLRFANGGAVETVLMPSHRADRAAGCVSSQ